MRTCHRIAIAAGVAGVLGFALGALVSRPASGEPYDTWRITMAECKSLFHGECLSTLGWCPDCRERPPQEPYVVDVDQLMPKQLDPIFASRFGGDAEHAIREHQTIVMSNSGNTLRWPAAAVADQAQQPAVTTEMIDRAVDAFAREFPAQYAACKSVDPSMSLKPMFGKILAAAVKG